MSNDLHLCGTDRTNGAPIVVKISHKKLRDYHVFTSHQVIGLYIASKDVRTAVTDLCKAVELLEFVNHEKDCEVKLTQDFYDLLQRESARTTASNEPPYLDELSLIVTPKMAA